MLVILPKPEHFYNKMLYNSGVYFIADLIKVQQCLKEFSLRNSRYEKVIGEAFYYQLNALQHIEFIGIEFVDSYSLDWLQLNQFCVNLKSLIFKDSFGINPLISYPIIQSPLKYLSTLRLEESPVPVLTLQNLISSSNINLQVIVFGKVYDYNQTGSYFLILELISKHCPNLSELGAIIGPNEITALFLILIRCNKLKILEIYGNSGILYNVDNMLPDFGRYLPRNLRELNIGAKWRFSSDIFAKFFENSNHIPLYKFTIFHTEFINDDHLDVILNNSMSTLNDFYLQSRKFSITQDGILKAKQMVKKASSCLG